MGQGRVEKLPRSGWVRRWIIGGLSRKHRRWLKRRLHRLRRLAERDRILDRYRKASAKRAKAKRAKGAK